MDSDEVLSDCPGSRLMLSCRETDSSTLMLLAQGNRSDVTFDTGNNTDATHEANGVGWYFNDSGAPFSWGFVRAGDGVNKSPCDSRALGDEDRLCWHIDNNNAGGYRCGENILLNNSTEFERIVYMPSPVVTPIPTLSQWGLIAMAVVLGIVGFMVIRRRKVTA